MSTVREGRRGAGGRWPVGDRSVVATVLGVPGVAAVGVAFALTVLGVFVDLLRIGTVGLVFQVCYVLGCLLAVLWVRRRSLFGPMVQPPLLLAVAIPAVALLAGDPRPGQGIGERLLIVGAPLVNAFPTMAWGTGLALVVGTARILLQRPEREPAGRRPGRDTAARDRSGRGGSGRAGSSAAREPDEAPSAARRPASPPPS